MLSMGLEELVNAKIVKVVGNRIIVEKDGKTYSVRIAEVDGVIIPNNMISVLMRLIDDLCHLLEVHGVKIEACHSKLLTWIYEQWKS